MQLWHGLHSVFPAFFISSLCISFWVHVKGIQGHLPAFQLWLWHNNMSHGSLMAPFQAHRSYLSTGCAQSPFSNFSWFTLFGSVTSQRHVGTLSYPPACCWQWPMFMSTCAWNRKQLPALLLKLYIWMHSWLGENIHGCISSLFYSVLAITRHCLSCTPSQSSYFCFMERGYTSAAF